MSGIGNKEVFGRNLKYYIERSGKSQREIADIVGVATSTLNDWAQGKKYPRIDKIELLAKYFGILKSDLIEDRSNTIASSMPTNLFPIEMKKFPLLGNIACGEPQWAEQDAACYVMAGSNIHADFCLRAKGDSMIGARIHDGDIVFIRKQDSVEDGEIAAVLIEDEATLKRVYFDREGGILTLLPENPMYKAQRYSGEKLNQVRILGKAVGAQIVVG